MDKADYAGDYMEPLQEFEELQNPFLWMDNVTFHKDHTLLPEIAFSEQKLKVLWDDLPFVQRERSRTDGLQIYRSEDQGYELSDEIHDRLDLDRAFTQLTDSIRAGEMEVSFEGFGITYDLPMTPEQEEVWKLWQEIDRFQNAPVSIEVDNEVIPLGKEELSELLKVDDAGMPCQDENGHLIVDKSKIKDFASEFAAIHDTRGKTREFLTSMQDIVMVTGGTYGRKMDQKGLIEYLEQYFQDTGLEFRKSVYRPIFDRSPSLLSDAESAADDIGKTYIEVDMTQQKLYYYEDAELKLETDVVTGNVSHGTDTPEGVNYVYAKQTNRILRGANYASFVKYWMPVNKGIGIHDASWRSSFGGTIYKTNGSHGCVNVPTSVAGELYEMVEIGTPVVMYYREDE